MSKGARNPSNWIRGGVGAALVGAVIFGIVSGTSSDSDQTTHPSSKAQLAAAGPAGSGPQGRQHRRHRRQGARRRAARHRRHHHGGRPSNDIVVSHCDWRSGSGCPAVPTHCDARGPLQDPGCTPGALDPAVTQGTIDTTICVSGYTTRVRPPTSYTSPLKLQLMAAYGVGSQPTSDFELDHLVSLELGGAPADPRNLFPEAYAPPPGARQKDTVENRLHDEVCSGAIPLARAQHAILDWPRLYTAPSSAPSGGGGAQAKPTGGRGCDPHYSGACLDPGAPDYDCAGGGGDGPRFVQGPVRVVGSDRFRLDSDGDGLACE